MSLMAYATTKTSLKFMSNERVTIDLELYFYPFYFNPDNFLGSLNKTFFKPKKYKQTPTKLKIKST